MVELLSPARDFLSLRAAFNNGADSVYIGMTDFNLRNNISNFSIDDIAKASEITHSYNSKLFICTNTVMNDNDIENLALKSPLFEEYEVDALIVSDLGALEILKDYNFEKHMSVQANSSNLSTLKVLKKLGVSRAILSRELNLEEIKNISKKSPIEIECFIHGALCMAVSGRCFLSSKLYDKDANRGECLQPCRKEWKIVSKNNESFDMEEYEDYSYFISPKDLCMIEHIPDLIDAGIDAFKIEGRARPADYVATTTRTYREAIDSYLNNDYKFNPKWIEDLRKVFNRDFDTGFFFSNPSQNSPSNQSTFIKKDIGQVINYYSKVKAAEIKLWDDLAIGDEIIIQGQTTGSINQRVNSMELDGKTIEKAINPVNIAVAIDDKVRPNDLVYKLIKRI